jgi:hypothetical protein
MVPSGLFARLLCIVIYAYCVPEVPKNALTMKKTFSLAEKKGTPPTLSTRKG